MTAEAASCGELRGGCLDRAREEPRGALPNTEGRLRWDSKILDVEVDRAAQKLQTASCTAEVVEAVVAVLTDAGSRLQRSSAAYMLQKEGPSLAACLKQEDEGTAMASQSFLDACSNLGAVFISLASALSQSMLLPLESFHRGANADHVRKKAVLEDLRERELSCSNAVTECLQKRDRARAGLQTAMREQEKTEKKAGEKKKGLARFTRGDGEKDIAAAELKVHKAASAQTASIEELARRTEEANEARLLRESAAKDVDVLLACIETVRTRLLARCLNNCALAYGEAARSMRKSAAEMQGQVSCLRLSQPTQDLPKGKGTDGDLPPWALEALKVCKKRPCTIDSSTLDVDGTQEPAQCWEERHPDSPFTAVPLRPTVSPSSLSSSQGFASFLKGRSETSPAILTGHTFPLVSPACEASRKDSSQFPFES